MNLRLCLVLENFRKKIDLKLIDYFIFGFYINIK